MDSLKKIVWNLAQSIAHLLSVIFTSGRFGLIFGEKISKSMKKKTRTIIHQNIELKLFVPDELNDWRAKTFASKEPETLAWIDTFESSSVFWDVGANIGLYSIYAAQKKSCKVVAIEPSIFNLEILAKNIALNKAERLVTIFPIALTNQNSQGLFSMSSEEIGGALSTFGKEYGYDGKKLDFKFQFRGIGMRMDNAVDLWGFDQPDFVKIDVDGIEHLVLEGIGEKLKKVKSLLIEINKDFEEQAAAIEHLMNKYDFNLLTEHRLTSLNITVQTFNQIWVKR
jgi:FkbM family methyltransferase